MSDIITILYTILYTLKSLVLYSLLVTVGLLVLYLPGYGIFKVFSKRLTWNISALIAAYIISFVCVVILYFVPYFMGLPLKGLEALTTSKFLFFLKLFGLFLLYAIFIALFAQLFIFLGAYITEKLKFKSFFWKLILALLIISFILNILIMIFPWILGGILTLIWL